MHKTNEQRQSALIDYQAINNVLQYVLYLLGHIVSDGAGESAAGLL